MKWCFLAAILFCSSFCPAEARIKAIIFDCDGVLVDSEGLKFRAWQEVLSKRGVTITPEYYSTVSGHTGAYILRKISLDYQLPFDPQIVDEKNQIYSKIQEREVAGISPMISVVKWASNMRTEGCLLLAVASSAAKKEILFNLNALGIDSVFDQVLSGKEDLQSYDDPDGVNKPKPYIYLEACSRLHIDPNECLVFEDSEVGVRAAKTAGCSVIAVPTKWTANQDFQLADQLILDLDAEKLIKLVVQIL